MWKAAAPLLILASPACSDACGNYVQKVLPSPDGKHAAVLFRRDCGATTDFSTQVSVVRMGTRPKGSGNVFIADADHGAVGRAAWGDPWADMKWVAPRHLVISYDARSRVFSKNGSASGVRITFERITR